jgi:hypothetical protein
VHLVSYSARGIENLVEDRRSGNNCMVSQSQFFAIVEYQFEICGLDSARAVGAAGNLSFSSGTRVD